MITINRAHEHHLKNIYVTIPKNKLTVVTGVSGSGKSTLLFDILQREAERQYMEAIGQKTEVMEKAKVDSIVGLAPCISIKQEANNTNPRSTIGTMTDIYTQLRLLYSLAGRRKCPSCHMELPAKEGNEEKMICPACKEEVENLTPAHFSFNTVQGACSMCNGLGETLKALPETLLDETKSIEENAIFEWDIHYIKRNEEVFKQASTHYGFEVSFSIPINKWSAEAKDLLLYGALGEEFTKHFPDIEPPKTVSKGKFEGLIPNIHRRYVESGDSEGKQARLAKHFEMSRCEQCNGSKLNPTSRQVEVEGVRLEELADSSLQHLLAWVSALKLEQFEQVTTALKEIIQKYVQMQLSYLTLNRRVSTLSGGEYQSFRLASVLQSNLSGLIYLLDEPTTGLHSKDTASLMDGLKRIRDLGNTVIVIEHDVDVMREADYILEIGPSAGAAGGELIAKGTLEDILASDASVIKKYLLASKPLKKSSPSFKEKITIEKASAHNLKNVSLEIPKRVLTTVVGVSGSGKSTLIFDVLANKRKVSGIEDMEIVTVEQKQIGRSSRSNAATYTDLFTPIRNLFAKKAKEQNIGVAAKDFSFNTVGGRCEACQGAGEVQVNLAFMSNFTIVCPECQGKRYLPHILEVMIQGKSIYDILEMTVDEAVSLFKGQKNITAKLARLQEVGLGYLPLGQPAPSLSGGEAQRIKIAKELMTKQDKPSLYLLDEPTNGLHPQDIDVLVTCVQALIAEGHTVIAVEHHLDFIRMSDYIIEMGPEGGEAGGYVVGKGTPEELKQMQTLTGELL